MITHHNPLIVAVDVPDERTIHTLSTLLRPHVAMIKIGLEGFVGFGPVLIDKLLSCGVRIFLDLKLHDIPRTAAAAARQLRSLPVDMLTVHAAGGPDMLEAVRENACAQTQIIAVTVLTSLDNHVMPTLGFASNTHATATRLGEMARQHGADGLVCAAAELPALAHLGGQLIVPGIRPKGAVNADQRRVSTPKHAMKLGATYLVIGRPITQAPDPVAAACAITQELLQ